MLIDRKALRTYLKQVDDHLTEPVELILIGGAAVLILCENARATHDLDVMPEKGMQQLQRAVNELTRQQKASRIDINTRADPFETCFPPDWRSRLVSVSAFTFKNLKVLVPTPEDLAVSKVFRFFAKDVEDINRLASLPGFDRDIFLSAFRETLSGAVGDARWYAQSFRMLWEHLYPQWTLNDDLLPRFPG